MTRVLISKFAHTKDKLTPVSMYGEYTEGNSTNFGVPSALTRNYLAHSEPHSRVRGSEKLKAFKFQRGSGSDANLTSITLKVVRKMADGFFDDVGSYDFTTEFLLSTVNETIYTIQIPQVSQFNVLEGDYIVIQFVSSGNAGSLISARDNESSTSSYFIDGVIGSTNIDYEGSGTSNDAWIMIELLVESVSAVAFGDSNTEGGTLNGSFIKDLNPEDITKSFPTKLDNLIGNIGVLNHGIGGSTTDDAALARFQNDVLDTHAHNCIFMYGTNSVSQHNSSIQNFKNVSTEMIEKCLENNIYPIICSIPPRSDFTESEHQDTRFKNQIFKELCNKYIIPFIDIEELLGVEDGTVDYPNKRLISSTYNSGDNVHFNEAGYTLIASELHKIIGSIGVYVESDRPEGFTSSERLSIYNPPESLQLYDTDLHSMMVYTETGWETITHS